MSTNRSWRLKNILLRGRVYGYDPCTENYAEKYFNRLNVQRAMHANLTGIPYKWTACSDVLIKSWKDAQLGQPDGFPDHPHRVGGVEEWRHIMDTW
ncbi:serine carboxypeptidase 24-like protein isoform X1 [Cinnamomum micranthum f. kanehirae]|uniref:Serine carboxypeptidase 24-like protein isoform X1 n=1 Tax=Cinnamomum micranthum f. kanehirae TaxID=337451 RepID=A0A3S3NFB6_9MAGN|nr:serine carboxypeptidase 24-like protein isoform X1 [Cinnamomum micranthum f. kanehirae]